MIYYLSDIDIRHNDVIGVADVIIQEHCVADVIILEHCAIVRD